MAAVTVISDFGAQENKVCHCFYIFPFYLPWSDGTGCHDLIFLMLSVNPAFSLFFFTLIKKFFSPSSLSAIRVVVIYIFEVVDISPGHLDSSVWFIQPGILCNVLCIYVK